MATGLLSCWVQDLDLDGFTEQILVPSPAPGGPSQVAASVAAGATGMFTGLPDPPKIRVIVRKRPLNRKVGWVYLLGPLGRGAADRAGVHVP